MSFNQALKVIENSGGAITDSTVTIKTQTPVAVAFEQGFEGHWGPNYAKWANFNPDDNDGTVQILDGAEGEVCLVLPLTQAMIDAAYTQQWWGGTFIGNGDKVKITKITLL